MKKRETFKLRSPEKRARVGERIKLAATSAGLSLKDLAEKSGTTPALIYQYVRGITNIPLDTLHSIAEVTKVGVEFFDPEKETRPGGGVVDSAAPKPAPSERISADMRFLYKIADAQDSGRDSRGLIDTLNQLLSLARASQDRRQEAYVLWRMGRAKYECQDYEEAKTYLSQAVRMFAELGQEEYRQIAALNLGCALMESGAMDAALEQAQEIINSGNADNRWLGYLNAGAVHYRRQQFADALRSFCEAARALEQVADADVIASGMPLLLTHLADVAKDTGHYESALRLLSRSIDQATEKRQADVYLESLLTMARCCQALGRLSDAKRQLEQAVVLAGFLFEDQNRLGIAKAMLAEIKLALGEIESAKELARSAVRISHRVGGPRGIALASLALAEIGIATGNFMDARDNADDAITEAQRAHRPHEQALARAARARACLGLAEQGIEGAIHDAESEARRSVQVADQAGGVRERALTRLTLSKVLSAAGRQEQAEAILAEIVEILDTGATTLNDLLGENPDVPMLLRSPSVDLDRVFTDNRVDAPQIEWQTRMLQGSFRPSDKALEPLRAAAAALTRLLAGLTAEDAVRYGQANMDAEMLYQEFGRLAVTEEDKRQLRLLAERSSLQGSAQRNALTAISGKS